jgi:hypothetical protein
MHYREDYPDQDPDWDKITITAKKVGSSIEYNKESIE